MESEKKKIRMVALDLDGTVFNEAKIITDHTKDILEKASRQGVVVLPATGRPEIGLPKDFLEIPGIQYALTANGARIIQVPSGKVMYEELIPWDAAVRAIHLMQQWEGCVWEVYFDGKAYVEDGEYHILYHPDISPAMLAYIRSSRIFLKGLLEKIEREQIGLEKINMMFEDTAKRNEKMKELQEKFPELAVRCATTFNIEINSAKAGKGIGLQALGKLLGIDKEEIMACGDAANDWNMLEMAGFPVVMANGDEETKKLAAFITRSNEEDGVAYAVEQFVLDPVWEIVPAARKDLPQIMEIICQAQEDMKAEGIPQWQDGYPSEEDFRKDLEENSCYILKEEGKILAVGTLHMGTDPNYLVIQDGNWKSEEPYGTIHRLAVAREAKCRGIAGYFYDRMERICREQGMKSMRIDTHRENKKMQEWIRKQGFVRCGTIFVEDGTPRDGFEKSLSTL
ncbi:MAG: GNAT family N-acetyltransferase [Clostridiales bacterium]|nr:GNAT family N-acetyltransferase [Clostridiales bacterium]